MILEQDSTTLGGILLLRSLQRCSRYSMTEGRMTNAIKYSELPEPERFVYELTSETTRALRELNDWYGECFIERDKAGTLSDDDRRTVRVLSSILHRHGQDIIKEIRVEFPSLKGYEPINPPVDFYFDPELDPGFAKRRREMRDE